MNETFRDYTITLADAHGRATVNICIDSIRELVAHGYSLAAAREEVEQNAFANAIERGKVSDDCWIEKADGRIDVSGGKDGE